MYFALALLPFFFQGDENQPEMGSGYAIKQAAYGKTMMVASANPHASRIGFSLLERGGNALDAAIAMQMVLGLVEPQSSGIGGGGLLLYYDKKEERVFAYDGRETAPRAVGARLPEIMGGEAVGTPGVLKMLEMAHQEKGKLPWKELFEPAVQLAEEGFPLSARLHELIHITPHLSSFSQTQAYLFRKKQGERMRNPELAQTLRLIANEGTKPFYEGEIAQDIVKAVQGAPRNPGTLSLEDLANYQAIKREPIETLYRGYQLFGFPPPSSGGIAIGEILGMLENKSLTSLSLASSSFIDLFCRASRAAYTDRNQYIGDPAFVTIPVMQLLDPHYLKNRLETNKRKPFFSYEHPSTTHISVIDREENAVAFTSSINNAFGSTLMVRGFFLNNQLNDFSHGPNRIEPGKRPMSSMSPTFVFRGKTLILTLGSSGGGRIIDYVAKALCGVLDFGLSIQEAIAFPNYTSLSEKVDVEKNTFLEDEIPALEAIGNQVRAMELTSGTQGIQVTQQGLIGGVDPRREGLAIGND